MLLFIWIYFGDTIRSCTSIFRFVLGQFTNKKNRSKKFVCQQWWDTGTQSKHAGKKTLESIGLAHIIRYKYYMYSTFIIGTAGTIVKETPMVLSLSTFSVDWEKSLTVVKVE